MSVEVGLEKAIVDKELNPTPYFEDVLFQLNEKPDIYTGSGDPDGVVEARAGDLYLDEDATGFPYLYIKQDADVGGDKTLGWVGTSGASTLATVLAAGNTTGGTNIDATGDGITFDSGSNLLDDYEEGTFTATFSDGINTGTQSSSVGRYTKIGNKVFIEIFAACTTIDSMSGGLRLLNLPFTASGQGGGVTGFFGASLAMGTAGAHVSGTATDGATYLTLRVWDTGAVGTNDFTAAKLSNGGSLVMGGSYTTTS